MTPQTVEREAVTADLADVAGWLQDQLGQQLTAYVAGLRDPKVVGKWRRGHAPRARPGSAAGRPTPAARMLVDAYGANTTRAWFLGSNSRLDDEAPAWLLRHADDPAMCGSSCRRPGRSRGAPTEPSARRLEAGSSRRPSGLRSASSLRLAASLGRPATRLPDALLRRDRADLLREVLADLRPNALTPDLEWSQEVCEEFGLILVE